MSITKDFENRAWKEPPFEDRYSAHDVKKLLVHARALEAMLKKVRNDPMITLRVQQVWEIDELLEGVEDSHK